MKKLNVFIYLSAITLGLLVACSSKSKDDWANINPYSGSSESLAGDITSIQTLNSGEGAIVNSHKEDWGSSSLELDYNRLTSVESPTLSAINAYYPRIKRLANGSYIMLYQQGPVAWNVYCAYSSNLLTWQNVSDPLFKSCSAQQSNGTGDTMCFSSADAIVLENGDLLAFVSYRLNNGYRYNLEDNGIIMKRSTNNGVNWSGDKVIYKGATWEPYALQLESGEIQLYFTDCDPNTGDSGVSLLRSTDDGYNWTTVGKVVRQKTGWAIDGSGGQIYSDQMASAIVLNDSEKIAVATETRFREMGDIYNISMAWSSDNWASAPLTGEEEGPQDRDKNFIESAAAPYLRQFPSGETILSYNKDLIFTMQIGSSDATQWSAGYAAFEGKGCWGAMELIDSHTLVAAMPETYTSDASRIQIGQFVLNHRIDATQITPVIDAEHSEWDNISDALFIGSESPTQAVFRFAYDAENVYCLIERKDRDIKSTDSTEIIFQSGDATGEPLTISLIPDAAQNKISCSLSSASCESVIYGTLNDSRTDSGYVVEIAIPRTSLRVVSNRLLFNATLSDQGGLDTFTGLTTTNYEKWLPIVLKDGNEPIIPVIPENGGAGTGSSWSNGNSEGEWNL